MTSALGIIASGHKFAAAALTLSFNARTYDEDTTGAANEDDTRTLTTSLSAGSAGDLAILCERRINGKSTTVPAANLNTGWTLIGTGPTNAANEFRFDLSYKIMTASDISSGSVTTGQSEVQQNTILFFYAVSGHHVCVFVRLYICRYCGGIKQSDTKRHIVRRIGTGNCVWHKGDARWGWRSPTLSDLWDSKLGC